MNARRARELRRQAAAEGRTPPPGRPLTLEELGFPRYLKDGQAFGKDGALGDWRVLWAVITAQPWWPELRDRLHVGGTRPEDGWLDEHGDRRPHKPMLIAEPFAVWLAFFCSGVRNLRPWVEKHSDDAVWTSLGLEARPNYDVVYRTLRKLYPRLAALRDYTDLLAKAIVEHVPDFMVDVAIDGTEWAAAVQLYHDCGEHECPLGKGGEHLGRYARGPLHNMTSEQAAAMRAQAIDAGADSAVGGHGAVGDAAGRVSGDVREAYFIWRQTGNGLRRYLRIKTDSGHWYLIRDVGAGIRMYEGKDGNVTASWVGRTLLSSTCKTTGLCGAGKTLVASQNEPGFYDELLEAGERATGWPTLTVSTDKAGTQAKVTEAQTRAGRLHISPMLNHMTLRGRPGDERNRYTVVLTTRRGRKVVIDPDDRIRCQTCGHETRQQFIAPTDGSTPFVRATCMTHLGCAPADYTITIEPRRLLPIPRYDARYIIRKWMHGKLERQHGIFRTRNNVAQKAKEAAPRQALRTRAEAELHTAIFLDHLRYLLRNGWLAPPPGLRHIKLADVTEETYADQLAAELTALAKRRRKYRLYRPFGTELAAKLGGTVDPPGPVVVPTTRAGP